jgi:alpha-1,2-rhamnosyltransferase
MLNYYIECTNTVTKGKNTGIERVVKNIIERLPKITQKTGNIFVPVIVIGEQFYKVNTKRYSNRRLSKFHFDTLGRLRDIIDNLAGKQRDYSMPVDILGVPSKGFHSYIVKTGRKMLPLIFRLAFRFDRIIETTRPVIFKPDDVLFLPDSIHNTYLFKSMYKNVPPEMTLILFVHDIIAIKYSMLFEKSFHSNFKTNYDMLTSRVDSVICSTKTVMHDVIEYNKQYAKEIKYDYAYLGSDFRTLANKAGSVRADLIKIMSVTSNYLMVGTIEPRKNHLYVLDVFQKLWEDGAEVSLCLVGRLGWLYDEIINKIKANKYLNNKLFFFSDLNDDELAYCYEKSSALIFASLSEGFGLPLVEAMHFGKPVLASDIPVFREIGGEYPFYFSLEKPDSLAGLIDAFERGALNKKFKPQPWITWDESIENLLRKVVEMAGKAASKLQA